MSFVYFAWELTFESLLLMSSFWFEMFQFGDDGSGRFVSMTSKNKVNTGERDGK